MIGCEGKPLLTLKVAFAPLLGREPCGAQAAEATMGGG